VAVALGTAVAVAVGETWANTDDVWPSAITAKTAARKSAILVKMKSPFTFYAAAYGGNLPAERV